MGGMPMPGGWTMAMVWMRMPGQTWPGAAASFLGMWTVMMVAMMLPSLVPMLWHYRQAVGRTVETRLGRLTALVGAGYFFVWTVFGMAAFPLGVALAVPLLLLHEELLARAQRRLARHHCRHFHVALLVLVVLAAEPAHDQRGDAARRGGARCDPRHGCDTRRTHGYQPTSSSGAPVTSATDPSIFLPLIGLDLLARLL